MRTVGNEVRQRIQGSPDTTHQWETPDACNGLYTIKIALYMILGRKHTAPSQFQKSEDREEIEREVCQTICSLLGFEGYRIVLMSSSVGRLSSVWGSSSPYVNVAF